MKIDDLREGAIYEGKTGKARHLSYFRRNGYRAVYYRVDQYGRPYGHFECWASAFAKWAVRARGGTDDA